MLHLLIASLIWAFSFGLIARYLPPDALHPWTTAAIRLLLACVAFAPFLARGPRDARTRLQLAGLGVIQFGLVYMSYLAAFGSLRSHEVALMTVFTPIFVWLGGDWLEGRFRGVHVAAAALACFGAAVTLLGRPWETSNWTGVLLMQASNLCFAIGQLGYRSILRRNPSLSDSGNYAWMLIGAACFTVPLSLSQAPLSIEHLRPPQVITLVYLGLIATGLGFYLWNRGAARVGVGVLAAANNLKLPLAVLVSAWVFSSGKVGLQLVLGLLLVTGAMALPYGINRRKPAKTSDTATT